MRHGLPLYRMRTNYPSSPTDAEWSCLQRFLPPRSPQGRLRCRSLRTIFDAIFSLLCTGCPWVPGLATCQAISRLGRRLSGNWWTRGGACSGQQSMLHSRVSAGYLLGICQVAAKAHPSPAMHLVKAYEPCSCNASSQ